MDLKFEKLDKFCGSPFWNTTLTWKTDDPDFTKCFEKSALVIIPAIFLWCLSPLEVIYLRNSPYRDIPWNWKNVSKLFFTAAISVICATDFLSNISSDVEIVKVNIYMPLVKLVTFGFTGILIYHNKKYGMQASGHQFIFWFLCLICGAPQFRTEIRSAQRGEVENHYFYISYLVYYPLVIAVFLLNCLGDNSPRIYLHGKVENGTPIHDKSFLGRIIYSYFDGMLYKGYKKPLESKDMWNLDYENQAKNLVPVFEKEFQRKLQNNKKSYIRQQKQGTAEPRMKTVSILPVIFKCFYSYFILGALCKLVYDFIIFANPQLLSKLISFVGSDEPQWKGLLYAFSMFAVGTFQTLIHNIHFNYLIIFGIRTRTCLMACIYRKALRISNATRKNKTVGEIVNLMAVDAEKFQEFSLMLPLLWSAPIELILAIYFLWQEVGPSILAGLGVMILLIPINTFIIRRTKRLQVKQMKYKDDRVKMMNEILNGIRVLKLYAWESSFEKIIEKIRIREIVALLKAAYLNAGMQFMWNSAPFVVSFVTFGTYVLIDENNVLDASKAFVSLSLLNILRMPLNMIPNVVNMLVQTLVSVKRINSFLNSEELEPYVEHNAYEADPLLIENGTFSWGDDVILKNINLRIPKNSLTAIVGPVGCGKSSLMTALLGEMHKNEGRVNTYGSIAYVSQQAWIQNATVKENIIFGKPFDKIRYNKVIDACSLRPDLEMLADGDMTEIGEKGINLSGGQKQRISLARAVYDNADIYLFDDPLSAVDSHVGKHIFNEVIGSTGLLNDKVRVLVTHAVNYLPKTNKIFVMKDGEITESGTYKELLAEKGVFADFLMQHISDDVTDENVLNELEEQIEDIPLASEIKRKISRQRSRISESSSNLENGIVSKSPSLESLRSLKKSSRLSKLSLQDENFKKEKGKLIQTERSEKGNVKLAVFRYYLSAVGLVTILITILFYTGFQGFGIGSNLWLGLWAEDTDMIVDGKVDTGLRNMYLYVYLALGVSQGFCIFAASALFARGSTKAAAKLHNILMGTVMRLPMQFFDVTPTGRILARFSSDIVGVDSRLPSNFNNFFFHVLKVLGTIVVICYTTPLFTIVIVPIGALYIFIQRYFVTTTRQIKRLESVSRSPVYSHFGETIAGTTVIRAYKCQDRFISESEIKLDTSQKCIYPGTFANRWLGVRLETIGNIIILTSALFAVLRKDLNGAMVGLSVSYALQITQTLNMLVRQISDTETNIVCVERIKEYSEAKQERPWEIEDKKPHKTWPDHGNVKFENYAVRYRDGLDLVLKGISFQVNGGEKIGIVGRTGAGKSSLTLSLFRIIEASQGNIFIDGIKISEIGLHDLRSKLTIIPQDAVLFSGTLRMNLDPFDKYSDKELWNAIELAHLKLFVSSLPAGLHHKVSEGGENLSVGQRQLICLARALLRKTKILVLDEATAAVDLETDDLIQKTIRIAFSDCTVLTIAHRLNTIMDSNRVLVLDKGQIAEFDTPGALLENQESIFFGMCKDAGLTS